MFDHPFRRRTSTGSVAAPSAWPTTGTWGAIRIAARPTAFSTRTTPVSPRIAWAAVGRPISTGSTATRATATGPVIPIRTAAPAARSAHRAQFVFGQFAVAVFVELLERCGSVGDFLRREFAIVICIEGFHEWIGGPAVPSPRRSLRRTSLIIAARRSLLVALLVALRRTFGRLRENGRRIERKNHHDKKTHPQHLISPIRSLARRNAIEGLI
jgi:hypothetical protein